MGGFLEVEASVGGGANTTTTHAGKCPGSETGFFGKLTNRREGWWGEGLAEFCCFHNLGFLDTHL